MKMMQSLNFKMDGYDDCAGVPSRAYLPLRGKGTNHSQHGMSGFGGTIKQYPTFEGQGLKRSHRYSYYSVSTSV